MFFTQLNLIRYMIVCRINSPIAYFLNYPSFDLSIVLGHAIAERVSVSDARKWNKSLSIWKDYGGSSLKTSRKFDRLPPNPWPIEAVLVSHTCRRNLGQGELVFFEIKLMGDSADHGFFLEAVLPSFEEIGHTKDRRTQYSNCLWGNFDIHAVYAAKGNKWEPLVKDGNLDLKYHASPVQWADDFYFYESIGFTKSYTQKHTLNWINPFELKNTRTKKKGRRRFNPPSLRLILDSLIERITILLSGKFPDPDKFWSMLNTKEKENLEKALSISSTMPVITNRFNPESSFYLHRRTGTQTFSTIIPDSICPYLTLASILHIGKHTHFGCGTFIID